MLIGVYVLASYLSLGLHSNDTFYNLILKNNRLADYSV